MEHPVDFRNVCFTPASGWLQIGSTMVSSGSKSAVCIAPTLREFDRGADESGASHARFRIPCYFAGLIFFWTGFQLKTDKHSRNFWIGNGMLAVAMLTLLFMGPLSDALGIWAAVLWMVLAAVGMVLVMSDKTGEPPAPD